MPRRDEISMAEWARLLGRYRETVTQLTSERDALRSALERHHSEYTHGPGAHCPTCETLLPGVT
jgi:hypothetical protein